MNDTITIDRKVVEQVLEALQLGQDAFNQASQPNESLLRCEPCSPKKGDADV